MSAWEFTQDPADPCPYCVSWISHISDYDLTGAVPYLADGSIARRVYYRPHPGCDAAVTAYVNDKNSDAP